MKLDDLHVIAVGGATAGAAAALLFSRAGARVTLIERVAEPQAVGAGIALAENGLAVLESLGLGPALAVVGRPVPAPRLVDGTGRVLLEPAGPLPRALMLRRSDLTRVLLDAVAAEPRIDCHFGAEVIGSNREGALDVRTTHGVHTCRGDVVIAADGVHSRLREVGNHEAKLSAPGTAYFRALVAGEHARGEEAWTSAGLFGSFAVRGGTYVYGSAGSREVRRALGARDLDAFRAAWARAYPPAAPILAGLERWDELLLNRVLSVEVGRWFDGRQVLVGDAAHAMAPNLGQGANSALVDVAVLLDELRRADGCSSGFARYQERRQRAVARVARTAARLGALAEITNPLGRWLRDRVLMRFASRLAGSDTRALVLQEPTATLLAIGRA